MATEPVRLTAAAARIDRVNELLSELQDVPWLLHTFGIASRVDAPEWWIGAGVIRDVIWDRRFGRGFDPSRVKDVDLGFFDTSDLSSQQDQQVELELRSHDRSVPWDAKNQAAVHLWYPRRFGLTVEPFGSAAEAIATFPEFCTCVGLRRSTDGTWDLAAPYGLDDVLDGVWRRNPTRVTPEEYQSRLARKRPLDRWGGIRVVP